MKIFVSGVCLLFASVFALPNSASAQTFSNADINGCYAATIEGTNLDPTSLQQLPTTTVARVCADGNGTVTWFAAIQNIGGCIVVGLRISGEPSTYSVNSGGNGIGTINADVFSVDDQCGGAVALPITVGETVQLESRLMLNGDLDLLVMITAFRLLDNTLVPAVPVVGSGIAYRQ